MRLVLERGVTTCWIGNLLYHSKPRIGVVRISGKTAYRLILGVEIYSGNRIKRTVLTIVVTPMVHGKCCMVRIRLGRIVPTNVIKGVCSHPLNCDGLEVISHTSVGIAAVRERCAGYGGWVAALIDVHAFESDGVQVILWSRYV